MLTTRNIPVIFNLQRVHVRCNFLWSFPCSQHYCAAIHPYQCAQQQVHLFWLLCIIQLCESTTFSPFSCQCIFGLLPYFFLFQQCYYAQVCKCFQVHTTKNLYQSFKSLDCIICEYSTLRDDTRQFSKGALSIYIFPSQLWGPADNTLLTLNLVRLLKIFNKQAEMLIQWNVLME